jgi:hypothetical protein
VELRVLVFDFNSSYMSVTKLCKKATPCVHVTVYLLLTSLYLHTHSKKGLCGNVAYYLTNVKE